MSRANPLPVYPLATVPATANEFPPSSVESLLELTDRWANEHAAAASVFESAIENAGTASERLNVETLLAADEVARDGVDADDVNGVPNDAPNDEEADAAEQPAGPADGGVLGQLFGQLFGGGGGGPANEVVGTSPPLEIPTASLSTRQGYGRENGEYLQAVFESELQRKGRAYRDRFAAASDEVVQLLVGNGASDQIEPAKRREIARALFEEGSPLSLYLATRLLVAIDPEELTYPRVSYTAAEIVGAEVHPLLKTLTANLLLGTSPHREGSRFTGDELRLHRQLLREGLHASEREGELQLTNRLRLVAWYTLATRSMLTIPQRIMLAHELAEETRAADLNRACVASFIGRLHRDVAWEARGTGFAGTVPESAWPIFERHSELCLDWRRLAIVADPRNVDLYVRLLNIARTQDVGLSDEAIFNAALAVERDNTETIEQFSVSQAPRWGGSQEAQIALCRELIAADQWQSYGLSWQVDTVLRMMQSDGRIMMQQYDATDLTARGYRDLLREYAAALATAKREKKNTGDIGTFYETKNLLYAADRIGELSVIAELVSEGMHNGYGGPWYQRYDRIGWAMNGPAADAVAVLERSLRPLSPSLDPSRVADLRVRVRGARRDLEQALDGETPPREEVVEATRAFLDDAETALDFADAVLAGERRTVPLDDFGLILGFHAGELEVEPDGGLDGKPALRMELAQSGEGAYLELRLPLPAPIAVEVVVQPIEAVGYESITEPLGIAVGPYGERLEWAVATNKRFVRLSRYSGRRTNSGEGADAWNLKNRNFYRLGLAIDDDGFVPLLSRQAMPLANVSPEPPAALHPIRIGVQTARRGGVPFRIAEVTIGRTPPPKE